MAHTQNTIQKRKFTHLSKFERGKIAALHWDGKSNREIGRRLERHHQTIANELKRGTTTQLKTGRQPYRAYFPETGQAVYEQNRVNCGAKSKLLVALEFVDFACKKILDHDWSPDAVVGYRCLSIKLSHFTLFRDYSSIRNHFVFSTALCLLSC